MRERKHHPETPRGGVTGGGKTGKNQGERNKIANVRPGRVPGGEERKKEKRRDDTQR